MILSSAADAYTPAAIGTLLAALGLSATAGLRAYIPLLAVGLASSANIIPLQDSFKDLASPPVIIILATLTVVEFIIDKVPLIDHVSDAVHTIIRPVSGGIIMAGTANSLSTLSPWVAAILGALLALVLHGAKATTRPAVSATTAGIGNPVVSLVEDVVVLAVVLLLIFAPIIGAILLVLLAVVFVRLVGRILRRFRRGRGGGAGGEGGSGRAGGWAKVVPAGAAVVSALPNAPNGKRGRKNRRGAPPRVALPPAPQGLPVAGPPVPMLPAVPIAAPLPAQAQPQPTVPPSPNAPTEPATYQPHYVPPLPAANPIFGGGMPGVIVPPGQTQPYPPSLNQQPGALYPPDASTLPGNTP